MLLKNHLLAVGALALILLVYLLTMPRVITLEDAGLFQMICHQGGIGHPPGYPLFILGCQGFVNLPFFSANVFAGNLFSALLAVAACGVLYLTLVELKLKSSIAAMAAVTYGFSQTFWSQAIIIEVYSLASLMFLLTLWFAVRYHQRGDYRDLCWLGFIYGLALSNHWPLQGLATPALMLVLWPRLIGEGQLMALLKRPLMLALPLGLAVIGLLPYVTLFQADPEIAVFGPITTLQEFTQYISRSLYSDHAEIAGFKDKLLFQSWVANQTMQEYSIWLMPVVLLGLVVSFSRLGVASALALIAVYLSATTLLIGLLGFEYNAVETAIYRPYPIVAYVSLAVWLALGVEWICSLSGLPEWLPRLLPGVLSLVVLMSNVGENYRANSTIGESYGRLVLSSVPDNALLFVTGDHGSGMMGYLHHVEGVRPDIELRSWDNLVFSNRLVKATAPEAQHVAARDQLLASTERPVFSTLRHDRHAVHHGLMYEFGDKAGFACDRSNHGLIQQLVYLDQEQLLKDGHERNLLLGLLVDLTRQHVGLLVYAGTEDQEEVAALMALQQTFAGKVTSLETLVRYSTSKNELQAMADAARAQQPDELAAQVEAVLSEYEGRIDLMKPANEQAAAAHFRRSIEIYPVARNHSVCELYRLSDASVRGELERQFDGLSCDV